MLCNPSKIICVGLNYKSHAEETGEALREEPALFAKFNDALAQHGQDIVLPPWHRCYDYEAELVVVMGKALYHAADREEARAAIGGYTCGNDLSARDCQFRSSQWLIGKSFPGFAPIGPRIVSPEDFDPEQPHRIASAVNGVVMQEDDVTNTRFTCAELVAYVSQFTPLAPGDLIFTGTPPGVMLGKPREQQVWLKPGDEVTVTIEGIGTLRNRMI